MRIITDWPPNIDAIRAAFPLGDRVDLAFAFGDRVYSPGSSTLHASIQAHEQVHCDRQRAMGQFGHQFAVMPDDRTLEWWDHYLKDPQFRLAEEIPAHRAEFLWWAARPGAEKPIDGFRSARLYHLHQTAVKLASPLYGRMISLSEARKAIEAA